MFLALILSDAKCLSESYLFYAIGRQTNSGFAVCEAEEFDVAQHPS